MEKGHNQTAIEGITNISKSVKAQKNNKCIGTQFEDCCFTIIRMNVFKTQFHLVGLHLKSLFCQAIKKSQLNQTFKFNFSNRKDCSGEEDFDKNQLRRSQKSRDSHRAKV